MMTSNFTSAHGLRPASPVLDSGIAALAAIAIGFATYAMPADLFARLVEGSGLPLLLTAAQPPLGSTARIAAIAAGALAAFGLVWLLMRALDRVPQRSAVEIAEDEIDPAEAPLPRLRRFDAHPDAPARRPIFAGREFGEPVAEEVESPSEPEPTVKDEPLELEVPLPPEVTAEFDPAPVAVEAVVEETASLPVADVAVDDSISSLMQRLEGGLERGTKRHAIANSIPPAREEHAAAGHRLRSAISDLQKMAGQG